MKRILVLEYSQSGDVTKAADAFTRRLERPGVELRRERIRPIVGYPYPWRSLGRLFAVFPECFLGPSAGIHPPAFSPDERFDLVLLAYQVWYLNPSLPIQSFLRSEHARVLKDTPVVTLCVSRAMWHSASETMKRMLREAGAFHVDNVVVTHPGAPFSTFVSVPRALLVGKKDRLWGIFPPAELDARELDRCERLGGTVAERLDDLRPPYSSLLAGLGAVEVKRRYIVPERTAWYLYRGVARLVGREEERGERPRRMALYLFMVGVLSLICVGMPLCLVTVFVLYPVLGGRIARYARRLAEPSG
ncbi:MAG TPA: hypothetical protein VH643_32315 [Gemmataceae bacterium]|jgi:hypothetical protein